MVAWRNKPKRHYSVHGWRENTLYHAQPRRFPNAVSDVKAQVLTPKTAPDPLALSFFGASACGPHLRKTINNFFERQIHGAAIKLPWRRFPRVQQLITWKIFRQLPCWNNLWPGVKIRVSGQLYVLINRLLQSAHTWNYRSENFAFWSENENISCDEPSIFRP